MPQVIVRCRCRPGLSAEDFRAWLLRQHQDAAATRFTVLEPTAPEGALWILELETDGPLDGRRDGRLGELVTDLRLLGLEPAVFVPAT